MDDVDIDDGNDADPMAAMLASAQARAAEYGNAPTGDIEDDEEDQGDPNGVQISSNIIYEL